MQVDLISIAHRAMDLDRGLGHLDRGVARRDLGVADVDRGADEAIAKCLRRAPEHRLGKFDRHRSGGELVLHRLKRTDWLTELGADFGIGRRLVEHRLGEPDQLRCTHQRAEIEQQRVRRRCADGPRQVPQRIDAVERRAIAIADPRIDAMRDRRFCRSRNDRGHLRRITLRQQPRHRNKGGIDQRFGETGAPTLTRDQSRIDEPKTEPAKFLGNQQAG